MSQIPISLVDNIKKRNVVLFLGSGFNFAAKHPKNAKIPLANDLGKLLANKFLGGEFIGSPLTFISDLSISEAGLFAVQSFISEILAEFTPNDSQIKFASFPWKAIFTTNYDQILEKAYQTNKSKIQDLSPVFRNTSEQQIFKTVNTVPYYKLHGCISYINDEDLPLILSTDQYITHTKNRDRLFLKLKEVAKDYSILFIGYSNQDPNIRSILKEIENMKDGRPRSYMISPDFSLQESRYWEGKKITTILLTYEDFINKLDLEISKNERQLSIVIPDQDKPIYKKFQISVKELIPTESLNNFLGFEAEYVHSAIASQDIEPHAFYKGFFKDWDPIIKNLDIIRTLKDTILSDLIFEDGYQVVDRSFLFVIKGYAGSGKSVLLKRIAWEAAVEFDKFCMYIKIESALRYEPIIELYNYVKERIYVFIDRAIDNEKSIIDLLERTAKDKIPVTILTTERINIWNDKYRIKNYLTEEYTLTYLNPSEIDLIINKLEIHNSLGFLKNKTVEERKKELAEKAGRVLLVALYEATGGKPFEEIILDEYNNIKTIQAKSLYLTVSILHRLGSEARAGLISRVHNISFNEFKEKLFLPLEFIVFAERNYFINDFVYLTRHQYIAQIIFETVLKSEQDRYDEYVRVLSCLDIDYKSDWKAFLSMTNAHQLLEIFKDPNRIRNLYDYAEKCCSDNPKLLQQRAIFEMNSTGGNIYKAEEYLTKAHIQLPDDPMISHSFAEICIKKAEKTTIRVEKNQLLNKAKLLCDKIIKRHKDQSHAYHTLLKINIIELQDLFLDPNSQSIEIRIKEIEKILLISRQQFPEEEFLIEIEAKFNEIIDNHPKAIELLEQAYFINKASPYIALRYSKLLENHGEIPKAIDTLKATLDLIPNDRDVNFRYAYLLSKTDNPNYEEIIHYYRRSFTLGDSRYEAQFWYARALHITNDIKKAKEVFKELAYAKVSPELKNGPRGIITVLSHPKDFKGVLIKQESHYAFIRREAFGDEIFMYRYSNKGKWEKFKINSNVKFNLAFNYKGAIAINVELIK
jgi:DNA repair exonuclease SbcCD nuclease subunit